MILAIATTNFIVCDIQARWKDITGMQRKKFVARSKLLMSTRWKATNRASDNEKKALSQT